MKKSCAITIIITKALFGASLLQAAAPQPASTYLTLTPHLASSVAAACSFADPQSGISQLHCLPTSSLWFAESTASETLCFFDKKDAEDYEKYASTPWIRRFFGTSKAPDASCSVLIDVADRVPLQCIPASSELNEANCFTDKIYCISKPEGFSCSENPGLITEYVIQQRLKKRREASRWEAILATHADMFRACGTHEDETIKGSPIQTMICPLKEEGIKAYIARAFSNLPTTTNGAPLIIDRFMNEFGPFWDIPWETRRYILATLVETELIKMNEPLPLSTKRPLEYAIEQGDFPLAEYLLEKGAHVSPKNDKKNIDYLLANPALTSVAVFSKLLEVLNQDFNSFDAPVIVQSMFQALQDTAFNQPPEVVRKKALLVIEFARTHIKKDPFCAHSATDKIQRLVHWYFPIRNAGEQALHDTLMRGLGYIAG